MLRARASNIVFTQPGPEADIQGIMMFGKWVRKTRTAIITTDRYLFTGPILPNRTLVLSLSACCLFCVSGLFSFRFHASGFARFKACHVEGGDGLEKPLEGKLA